MLHSISSVREMVSKQDQYSGTSKFHLILYVSYGNTMFTEYYVDHFVENQPGM